MCRRRRAQIRGSITSHGLDLLNKNMQLEKNLRKESQDTAKWGEERDSEGETEGGVGKEGERQRPL
jgi:hypothetical protein